jgi:hypothetical protein
MEKKYLTQVIDKYHLNGLVESVTWNSTKSKGLTVKFVTATKDCAGSVHTTKDLELGENDISIYSTSQLNRILSVIDNYLTVDVVKGNQNIPYQLSIKDNNFDLTYHLSSEDLIPTVPNINEPEQFDCTFSIDEDFVKNFTRAHNALDKPNRFTIECKVEDDEQYVEFCVGDSASYANKIKLRQPASFLLGFQAIPFSANIFKEIISVNKSATSTINILEQGLIKMTFTEDDTTSTYFMVKLSE